MWWRINLDYLGFSNVPLNLSVRVFLHTAPTEMRPPLARNRTRVLELSSEAPYVLSHHGGSSFVLYLASFASLQNKVSLRFGVYTSVQYVPIVRIRLDMVLTGFILLYWNLISLRVERLGLIHLVPLFKLKTKSYSVQRCTHDSVQR